MPQEFNTLGYALYACVRLEEEMLALGWTGDAAHYRQRQTEIRRELQKLAKP